MKIPFHETELDIYTNTNHTNYSQFSFCFSVTKTYNKISSNKLFKGTNYME